MTDNTKGAGARFTLQIALGVFLGVALLVGLLAIILANRGPSAVECADQAIDVAYGVRDAIDPACR